MSSLLLQTQKISIEEMKLLTSHIQALLLQYKNLPFWIGGDSNLPDINQDSRNIIKPQYNKETNKLFIESLDVVNPQQIAVFSNKRK